VVGGNGEEDGVKVGRDVDLPKNWNGVSVSGGTSELCVAVETATQPAHNRIAMENMGKILGLSIKDSQCE
jgi:hypothetical protein